ncbi:MAG TPA: hypothetical protein VMU81_12660 [Acetobacteraceae bacterium]|nr:hypothetical protein [Acetobacteraceae bacterium]
MRIVTVDDQLAGLRLGVRPVLDHHAQTRTRMEFRRERVVDQLEVTPLAAELDIRNEQFAVADNADRNGLLRDPAIASQSAGLARPIARRRIDLPCPVSERPMTMDPPANFEPD